MFDIISKFFGRGVPSKEVAKNRLKLVLVHDRASISPQVMGMLKQDLIKVITKYIDIDEDSTDINLSSSDRSVALVASIPIRGVKKKT